ncbi:MAG: glutathione S-transferase family protein [Candidatus Levyibacteriota bacterium]
MITVYGAPPTRAMRVIWMLEEMGLPYEINPVPFDKRFDDPEFLEASPTGAYPGMRDGDVCLMESCAMLEYLGGRYGPTPLTPTSDDARYPAYVSYLHFGEASLSAPLNVKMATRFFAPDDQKENWGARYAIDAFVRKSAALLIPLRRGPFMAGDDFTAADISCGFALGLAHFLGIEDRLDPTLREYFGRLSQRPAYQRMMSKKQPVS